MDNFYKKCQNLSKNEGILEENDAQTETKNESGRSMVEMLGVLAVVGVLSVGAISGYRYAMNKYRANQVTNELNLLSHQVAIAMMSKNGVTELKLGEPYDTDHKLTSAGFNFEFGCGDSTTPDCGGKYYFNVQDVSEGVCKELVQMSEHMQFLKTRTDTCSAGNNALNFVFELPDGMSSGNNESSSEDIPATPSLDKNCSGNGVFLYGRCSCDFGFVGDDCQTPNDNCSGHGVRSGSYCNCDSGYKGNNCETFVDCNGRGNNNEYWAHCHNCVDSYGWFCELDEDPCVHGHWDLYVGCQCDSGFEGEYCTEPAGSVCKNGGSWSYSWFDNDIMWGHVGHCACPNGYSGYDCSVGAK